MIWLIVVEIKKKQPKNLSELLNADEEKFAGNFNASYEKQALSAQSFSTHTVLEVYMYVRCSE